MARPRKFDEDEVVAAARERFWATGYDGTSMSDLVEATGVASQSLYGAFGSKHGLFMRTLHAYCTGQIAGLTAAAEKMQSPWQTALAAVTFDEGGRPELTPEGCFLSSSAVTMSRRDHAVRELWEQTYDDVLRVFVHLLRRARDLGEIRPDVNIDDAAVAMIVAMQGIEFLRKSGASDEIYATAKRATTATLTAAYTV
ncbi:TetR/AcrR family transcriptional regulator [Actinoplanes sp. TBRC 11911]|uniref:TetR/AcrR family transcriptional regulator n=1 Tax=Actinoplanes sp. TBRC 11911 TaxID=2729386 RepID=UPI00145F28CB|nr:TetR/AcrR family transcriptional regulator [Actinoplanes sp. TBRC 11911]NMO55347.1 TetR/AcrR family transcriptional regulator [Actinoplanes sp. TBRC 11911]